VTADTRRREDAAGNGVICRMAAAATCLVYSLCVCWHGAGSSKGARLRGAVSDRGLLSRFVRCPAWVPRGGSGARPGLPPVAYLWPWCEERLPVALEQPVCTHEKGGGCYCGEWAEAAHQHRKHLRAPHTMKLHVTRRHPE
jgi:hypothetical protein